VFFLLGATLMVSLCSKPEVHCEELPKALRYLCQKLLAAKMVCHGNCLRGILFAAGIVFEAGMVCSRNGLRREWFAVGMVCGGSGCA
jgi:hypothetical protein